MLILLGEKKNFFYTTSCERARPLDFPCRILGRWKTQKCLLTCSIYSVALTTRAAASSISMWFRKLQTHNCHTDSILMGQQVRECIASMPKLSCNIKTVEWSILRTQTALFFNNYLGSSNEPFSKVNNSLIYLKRIVLGLPTTSGIHFKTNVSNWLFLSMNGVHIPVSCCTL